MSKAPARAAASVALLAVAAAAHADPVTVYAAGSLRQVVGDLSKDASQAIGGPINGSFGGSGAMRQRIERGEPADLLLSADMASPRKLEAEGRAALPPVAFARNTMCVVSRRAAGITSDNLIAKLLDPSVRVRTSTPIADPSGDYAWAIFDKIDAQKPGAGAVLKAKAQTLMTVSAPAAPGQDATGALFAADKIDVTLAYCSAGLDKASPNLVSLPVPAVLDPHPVFGLVVLSTKPEAVRLALYILSDKGQAIIAKDGLIPLVDPSR